MKKTLLLALMCLMLISCGRKSLDEQFAENARQESQQICPRIIDECTVLDSVTFDIPTRTQYHYYTFKGDMDNPKIFTDNFYADTRETLLKGLRNEIKLKKQMDAGISFGYVYRSASTKKNLLKFIFTEKDYRGPLTLRTFNQRITGKWEDYTQRVCPEKQDEYTTLDSISFDSLTHTLYHNFTLKAELDIPDFNEQYPEATRQLKTMMTNNISKNDFFKEENDSNISYIIRYFSKQRGKQFIEIKISGKEVKRQRARK